MPSRVGRYELLRHLATGGMAEIYLARVTGIEGFEKLVVVKRIKPDLSFNQDMVRMFLDEARLAATLHHPNIVQVYDVGMVDGNYFFSMEFVHGQDVRSILKSITDRGRAIPLAEAVSIVLGICSGLHYAHEKVGTDGNALNIIHRDVSPSNILVSYDGAVKLVDFGIAKATSRTAETTVGGVRGKLSYMAPEQCQHKPLDRRSDVFAIGILLFELTTCTKLFGGESDYDIMKSIVETPLPRPSSRRSDYPDVLERVVLKALAYEPNDRYATAEEMQLDLEAFARAEMLATSPVMLARFMGDLFRDKIEAWKTAQREGKPFSEHVMQTIGTVSSGSWAGVEIEVLSPEGKAPPREVDDLPSDMEEESLEVPTRGPRKTHVAVVAALLVAIGALGLLWWRSKTRPPADSVSAPAGPSPTGPTHEQVLPKPEPAPVPPVMGAVPPVADPKPGEPPSDSIVRDAPGAAGPITNPGTRKTDGTTRQESSRSSKRRSSKAPAKPGTSPAESPERRLFDPEGLLPPSP